MSVWDVKRDDERMQWNFVPLVSVGPLKFGANHEEVVDALDGARAGSGVHDWRTESWLEADFSDLGVIAYYRDQKLFCVAVDGRTGPQVTFERTALTGRAPSAVEQWMTDQTRLRGRKLRYSQAGESELADLGLVARAQRAGDILVSRPVFVSRHLEVTWDEVPGNEWRRGCW
jgi:hypothetical protein